MTPDELRSIITYLRERVGIDAYKTARKQGLPCNVLQGKDAIQNRYGFVLIE